MDSPFTPEEVAEWASFGPKLKGKPTPDQVAAAQERKAKCTAFKEKMHERLDKDVWSLKKIEKELDRLVEEGENETEGATILLQPPTGTRDFYPDEMRQRNWLFGHFRAAARAFGFEEYDAPVLEHTALYERKAGEEIVDQMYAFTDAEGHNVTLRPELTPSLARLVLQKTSASGDFRNASFPLKWFAVAQCWRFEATQRGRKREHYQWNMDVVGVEHVHAELELLAAACDFFRRVGVTAEMVGIKVNSRAVLERIVRQSCTEELEPQKFMQICVIIDKLDKIGDCAVTELLTTEQGLSEESCKLILECLRMPTIEALSEHLGDSAKEALEDVQRVFDLSKDYGFSDYLIFDASVVRGLAYYTGIVWEAFDRKGELRAIMGGGRYDRLLELYGGPNCQIPCVGFGFGDCVIVELLKENNLLPSFNNDGIGYVVCAYTDEMYGAACRIAAGLRQTGATVDLMPSPKKKVARSFAHADRIGAQRMAFVAPSEVEKGLVRIKDLRTKDPATGEGVQVDVPIDQLDTVDSLIEAIANGSK